ncbi:HNH endonuclease [Leifsonia sp. WHRI 6310E]|uniref:HNH endonuclease n=1 Tax=Leifsonia sp. WHRI 6310E TaxID=3162562 RepID=UPI0032EC4829
MTALVLETYGRECWLKLPGCKRVATTKDHVVPFSHGGEDVLENYRPACRSCNSKRQNRVRPGYGASVVVVIGPPASGKSTYVAAHCKPGDVTIDMDRIARALMPYDPPASHTYPQHVRHIAVRARKAAIHSATRLRERVTVWLIHAVPTGADLAEYRGLGWQVVTIDPGRAIVEQRAMDQRPEEMMLHVRRWYSLHGEAEKPAPVASPGAPTTSAEPDW